MVDKMPQEAKPDFSKFTQDNPTADKYEIRTNFTWGIQQYWEGIRYSLMDGNIVKYYNLITAGLEPLVAPIIDEKFENEKKRLRAEIDEKFNVFWAGKQQILTRNQQDTANFEYASLLFVEIQKLLKRMDLIGVIEATEELKAEGLPPFSIQTARDRMMKKNQNWLCVVTGEPGTGKTWSALSLAHIMDPNFTVQNVAFNASECLRLIDENKDKKGSILIFDEGGAGLGAREYQSQINKQFTKVMETFRLYNLGLIFTLPSFNDLDKKARGLAHNRLVTKHIDESDKKCRVKWFNVIRNNKGDIDFRYITRSIKGQTYKLKDIGIPKPPKETIIEYERRKREFADALLKNSRAEIDPFFMLDDEGKVRTKWSYDEIKAEIIKNYNKYKSTKGTVTREVLSEDFGLATGEAVRMKIRIDRMLKEEGILV